MHFPLLSISFKMGVIITMTIISPDYYLFQMALHYIYIYLFFSGISVALHANEEKV